MIYNFFLLSFYGISACFVAGTVAREAIVGGDVAQMHQFPYQVSIQVSSRGHDCGGGIVNNNSILTAASCVMNSNNDFVSNSLSVLAGTYDLHQTNARTVTIRVVTIYVPTEFNAQYNSTTGDIAVLKLQDALHMAGSSILRNLKLPTSQRETFAGQIATIAGFGMHWVQVYKQGRTGGRHDTRLRFADAEVLDHYLCQHNHPDLGITEKHLCARVVQLQHSQPRGVCVGDGGGPLVVDGVVIGIFSLGPKGCSEQQHSAIYTRVSHFLQFIRHAKMGTESLHLRKINLI